MSFTVCARCGLNLIRGPAHTRPRIRRMNTLQPRGFDSIVTIPTLASQLPSLDPLPETPFNTVPIPASFIRTTSPEVTPLLEAIRRNDDREMWRVYTWLTST